MASKGKSVCRNTLIMARCSYHYTKEICSVPACVCLSCHGRSPEVALTPRPWLALRSTEKLGGVGDGRAESA